MVPAQEVSDFRTLWILDFQAKDAKEIHNSSWHQSSTIGFLAPEISIQVTKVNTNLQ